MADTASAPVKSAKTKKPRVKPTHPPTTEMVASAISTLKERNGSSLCAIKKTIAATYKVDVEKLAPFIKKSIKTSVASGALVQTKGKGASGSFKLAAKDKKPADKVAKAATKKTAAAAKAKKPAAAKPKKTTAAKPKTAAAKKSVKAKTPSKAKKTTKAAAKKPKSPKPKKTAKKAAPKKTVSKK